MRVALREEMNRIWQMKTVDFIAELGETFRAVARGETILMERQAAILHRLYSMLYGSVRLHQQCFDVLKDQGFRAEEAEIREGLRAIVTKIEEAELLDKDPFTWLAERPTR